jgi:hypothetical protein
VPNEDPFYVLGYYGVTAIKWKVTKCFTRNTGRMAYVSVEKSRKKGNGKGKGKDSIPPLGVADIVPPPLNETVGDTFDDLGMLEEEGNPDKVRIPMGQDVVIKSKKARRMKSPINTKWIVPIVLSAISATPNLPSKEITALPEPYIINMFLTSALIHKVHKSIRNQVFGDLNKNVTCVPVLRDLLVVVLEDAQHDLDIYVKTPMIVKKCLLNVILEQKMNSVKKENKMMVKAKKLQYLDK